MGARPKTSEHQLGLTIDIVSMKNQRLDPSQEKTAEQQWLIKNSWKYGFILRYPINKNSITKVGYEHGIIVMLEKFTLKGSMN